MPIPTQLPYYPENYQAGMSMQRRAVRLQRRASRASMRAARLAKRSMRAARLAATSGSPYAAAKAGRMSSQASRAAATARKLSRASAKASKHGSIILGVLGGLLGGKILGGLINRGKTRQSRLSRMSGASRRATAGMLRALPSAQTPAMRTPYAGRAASIFNRIPQFIRTSKRLLQKGKCAVECAKSNTVFKLPGCIKNCIKSTSPQQAAAEASANPNFRKSYVAAASML